MPIFNTLNQNNDAQTKDGRKEENVGEAAAIQSQDTSPAKKNKIEIFTYLEHFAREQLCSIFSNKVVFAFFFGDFIKENQSHFEDLNLFIVLKDGDLTKEKLFRTSLFKEQIKFGLHVDDENSIQIVYENDLEDTFKIIDSVSENGDVTKEVTSDFIKWVKIIFSLKIFIYGDNPLLQMYESKCSNFLGTWKTFLLDDIQKKNAVDVFNTFGKTSPQSSFVLQKKMQEKTLLSIFHFEIDTASLRKIILAILLENFELAHRHLKNHHSDLIPEHAKITLDRANGSFETYYAVEKAYNQMTPDLRTYTPFLKQYTFENSNRDIRETLMSFCISRGILPDRFRTEIDKIVTGSGSGYILNRSIQAINNNKGHLFIIPVPTYGFFIPSIAACGAKPLFVDTTSYHNFALPAQILEQIIVKNNAEQYNSHIKHFISEFKNFIQNLRSKQILLSEIEEKIDLQTKESRIYESAIRFQRFLKYNLEHLKLKYPNLSDSILNDYPELPRVKSLYFINPHNPLGIIYGQEYIDSIAAIANKFELTIIEDLSHIELIYDQNNAKKIGFFNQSTYPLEIITLMSPSKSLCMAECRVGFGYFNNSKLVTDYTELVFNDGIFLSRKQCMALENSFVINQERTNYLTANAKEYKQKIDLVKYILHADDENELSRERIEEIKQILQDNNIRIEDLRFNLDGIQMLNQSPLSGLFCVLDFTTALKNKYFLNLLIQNNDDLKNLLSMFNIQALTGSDLYCTEKLLIRFPISEPLLLILATFKRLQKLMREISDHSLVNHLVPSQPLLLSARAQLSAVAPIRNKTSDEQNIFEIAHEIARRIGLKRENLKRILLNYQPQKVTDYEIERSIRTLLGLQKNESYLNGNIEAAAVMLPSNLPLYSIIIFAVIPSFISKYVYLRPNSILQKYDVVTQLFQELELNSVLPGLKIINKDHAGFECYIRQANLVVFTGKPSNAESLLNNMQDNSILIVNGSGHNPLVVTESADMDEAVNGALLVKGFNGGQDCAGPDAILVHQSRAREFIQKFQEKFMSLHVGTFDDPKTDIGPIHRFSELQKFAEIFNTNQSDIICGGSINFKSGAVEPTIIVRNIERRPNYKEVYGPVAFIHPYKDDHDLSLYFEDPDGQYQANRMYVSLYGQSSYLQAKDDTLNPGKPKNAGIILSNQTIHDSEIGYDPYGGYSLGASAIIKKINKRIERIAMPILIPQVISEYLIRNKNLPSQRDSLMQSTFFAPSVRRGKEIDPIIESFQALASSQFKDNLLFGFIFGSAAKGKLTVRGQNIDDLDTFICLKVDDQQSTNQYIQKLADLHRFYQLEVDASYPSEIISFSTLSQVFSTLSDINVSIDRLVSGKEFDHIFWAHALTDKKTGFIGNNEEMLKLIRLASPHIARWSEQILLQIRRCDQMPEHLLQTFPGLDKEQILDKLKTYTPHLIVHLGLQYNTNTPTPGGSLSYEDVNVSLK